MRKRIDFSTFSNMSHELCQVTLSRSKKPTENHCINKSRRLRFSCCATIASSGSLSSGIKFCEQTRRRTFRNRGKNDKRSLPITKTSVLRSTRNLTPFFSLPVSKKSQWYRGVRAFLNERSLLIISRCSCFWSDKKVCQNSSGFRV